MSDQQQRVPSQAQLFKASKLALPPASAIISPCESRRQAVVSPSATKQANLREHRGMEYYYKTHPSPPTRWSSLSLEEQLEKKRGQLWTAQKARMKAETKEQRLVEQVRALEEAVQKQGDGGTGGEQEELADKAEWGRREQWI